jgi:single-strand DNA-binding protein
MRYTPAGQAVTNFNLAANRQYTDSSGQVVKETTWFRVSAWGKTAENCNQYLHKGSLVLVEGRLVCDPETGGPRLYTRQDGSPASSFEVSASTVRFLSGRRQANRNLQEWLGCHSSTMTFRSDPRDCSGLAWGNF